MVLCAAGAGKRGSRSPFARMAAAGAALGGQGQGRPAVPMPVEAVGSWQLGPGSEELPPHLALVRGPVVLAASEEFPGCDLSKPVEFPADTTFDIQALSLSEVPFEAQQAFKVALQNGWMEFTDYASAGKGYDKRIAVWVRVRQ